MYRNSRFCYQCTYGWVMYERVRDACYRVRDAYSRVRDACSRVRDAYSIVRDACPRLRDAHPRVRELALECGMLALE